MEKVNCIEEVEKSLIIEAEDESKEKAYGNIFTILRKQVYKEVKGLIVQMEPQKVYELEEEEYNHTEKFLGLFMPKDKKKYRIKAEIVVLIKYIPL